MRGGLKEKSGQQRGFTLVELMIVIVIILIFIYVVFANISNSRNNSVIATYKSALKSLQVAISFCCTSSTATLLITEGGAVCNPVMGSALLPTKDQLRATSVTYAVSALCSAQNPALSVTPAGFSKTACNFAATVSTTGTTFPAGC